MLEEVLKDKEIVVSDTKKNKAAFILAHVLRDYARITYCVDDAYEISENQKGVRRIEGGRVYLIKGDLEKDRQGVYKIIRELGGNPEYEFNTRRL
jgi:hypothetical protein